MHGAEERGTSPGPARVHGAEQRGTSPGPARVHGAEQRGTSLRVEPGLEIPLSEVVLRASRSSGPGGQHANVTASRVEAVFDVLGSRALSDVQRARLLARLGPRVVAVAQDERSQSRNRELALARLSDRIARALVQQRPRRPTRPTAASRARRLQEKQRTSRRKLERRRPAREED